MALSSISQATLLADLRLRLREATASVWTDDELKSYLNVAQYEIAVKLNGISDVWYGTLHTLVTANDGSILGGAIGSYDISSGGADLNVYKIINIVFVDDSGNVEILPIVDFAKLVGYKKNSYYGTSKYVTSVFGQTIYFSMTGAVLAASFAPYQIVLNYYRKPTEMNGSNGLDVPPEFQDLVLMFATVKAYEKLNQPDRIARIEKEISQKLREIKQSFLEGDSNDISPNKKSDKNKN